jgi:hypothetical protein
MMPAYRTATIDFGDIIRFPTMHIPRFVTWRDIRKSFPFIDLLMVDW